MKQLVLEDHGHTTQHLQPVCRHRVHPHFIRPVRLQLEAHKEDLSRFSWPLGPEGGDVNAHGGDLDRNLAQTGVDGGRSFGGLMGFGR